MIVGDDGSPPYMNSYVGCVGNYFGSSYSGIGSLVSLGWRSYVELIIGSSNISEETICNFCFVTFSLYELYAFKKLEKCLPQFGRSVYYEGRDDDN